MSQNEGDDGPYFPSMSWLSPSTSLAELLNEDTFVDLRNGHYVNCVFDENVMSFPQQDGEYTIGETSSERPIGRPSFHLPNTVFQVVPADRSIRPSIFEHVNVFGSSGPPTPTTTIRFSPSDHLNSFTSSNQRPPTCDIAHTQDVSQVEAVEADATFWSGIGQKYDVNYEILPSELKGKLRSGTALGHGAAGTVQRVVCRGIPLARKSIRTTTSAALAAAKSEVEAIRNLRGHHHIVQLVGTYITTDHGHTMYHLLTFPVADCDMDTFLNDCESFFHDANSHSSLQRISQASNIASVTMTQFELLSFIKKSLGCITNGIQWMHDAAYSHEDIKPSNILLRAGEIYITDFGISRNRRNAEDTSTETYPGSSYGWCAPEKTQKHNPYLSDVYSLGCFFMHVITVLSGRKRRRDCFDILQSPPQHRERYIYDHFLSLELSTVGTQPFSYDLADLAIQMLRNEHHSRPSISDVHRQLISLAGGSNAFHNSCCYNSLAASEPASAYTPAPSFTPASGYTPTHIYQCDRGSCVAERFTKTDEYELHLRNVHRFTHDDAKEICTRYAKPT